MSPREQVRMRMDDLADNWADESLSIVAAQELNPEEKLFHLLVDVADAYVARLENIASDEAAPFFASSTPLEAAINGLIENLDMIRE